MKNDEIWKPGTRNIWKYIDDRFDYILLLVFLFYINELWIVIRTHIYIIPNSNVTTNYYLGICKMSWRLKSNSSAALIKMEEKRLKQAHDRIVKKQIICRGKKKKQRENCRRKYMFNVQFLLT